MRNKYKRKEQINILGKKPQVLENSINHSSAIDLQNAKNRKIENVIFERTKPIFNRYEKINYIKEKNNDKIKKEENLNENKKSNNINKDIQTRYKKLNINIIKDEKKLNHDYKQSNVNSSKIMVYKPKYNNYYKNTKFSNDKNSNKDIMKNTINKNESKMTIENNNKNQNLKNTNIKYIYRKDKPLISLKETDDKILTLNLKPKRNYIPSQTEISLKPINQNNYEQKNIKKKNNNLINSLTSLLENKNRNNNNEIEPRQSFKYLVHQASKNREISNSFHKYYESRQRKSSLQNFDSNIKDDTIKSEENSISKYKFRNLNVIKSLSLKGNNSNSSINSNNKESKYNSLTDRKIEISNKNNLNNVKIINYKYNINQKDNGNVINNKNEDINSGNKAITQNIINNNIYNTTLNFYKIGNIFKSKLPKPKYLSTNNIIENEDIIYEDELNLNKIYSRKISLNNINTNINEEYSNRQKKFDEIALASAATKSNLIVINFEYIISLEKRMKLILEKINKYHTCEKECLEYIIYFFNNKLYNEEIKAFKHNHTKKNFLDNLKIEILCFFLFYDILFSKSFNQTAILFKTIFNLIYSNFLIFISFIINNTQINSNKYNQKIIADLNNIVEQDLNVKIKNKEINDFDVLQLIANNSKNINNYYKIVIDNIYGQYYLNNNNIRFPQCLNNKNINNLQKLTEDELLNIKSVFFFDAYRLLTNYNFDDLYKFFNIYLKRAEDTRQVLERNYNNIINKSQKKGKITIENKIEKFLLPKIRNCHKYSLVLDLDETLICIKKGNNKRIKLNLNNNNLMELVLRPGLIDFLQKMKKLYELILFSLGTNEYVSPIVKNIEKKEKFFEHILYREHVTYDDNGNFFKNLNLLNRDVKNILIVDDNYKNFKYHKSNGICIKPFNGDSNNDKNTLKILGNILYKIRYDADLTGDIRISLDKEKNSILFSQIATNY